ncbi:hypothetical protein N9222_01715 [Pseudomonadales bacterium]|nr:hypothetical protein [Pseudomonadales bacterium]
MKKSKTSHCNRVAHLSVMILVIAAISGRDAQSQDNASINTALESIRKVGKEGTGFSEAIPAANQLRQTSAANINLLLNGMAGTNPVAENWLRGVIFDVARKSTEPMAADLQNYAMNQSNNPKGRGLAMELLQKEAPQTANKLITDCLNDPSLPLREMAVEQAIARAAAISKEQPDDAVADYRAALAAARHPRQLTRIIKALEKLGKEVNTADAFVLLTDWQSLAPMDNVEGVGFKMQYAPESEFQNAGAIDLKTEHDGKVGKIKWQPIAGSSDLGEVDLAEAYNKEKGAIAYLFAEFESDQDRPAQARLGCINANKIWINGKLIMQNEVYHSGSMIDQYTADFPLKKGTNRILLKICQNEQEESWAQDWKFQFRITDPSGKGLASKP